ncbi:MAG: ABC transporter substrate-binding protein [Clostridiales bacterium]|nr:ABC transporter substrate-binding protein [Clostridiales bacterium]
MFRRMMAVFLCAVLTVLLFAGCGQPNDISSGAGAQDYPVTIGTVRLNSEPKGVAVLSVNLADVVLALDYEIVLKAKSAECTQSDLSVLPNVTADDAAKIKSLGVDLVLTDKDLSEAQKTALNQKGITVLKIQQATEREDLDRLYSQVGAALKGAKTGYEHGIKISQSIFLTIDDVTRVIPDSNTPITAVYLYDLDGGAATGDMLQGKLLEAAGLVNAADDGTKGKFGIEELLRANPQYIFCPTGLKAKMALSAEYAKLTAVKEKRVFEMDPAGMRWQGREMIDAVTFMAGTVYPDLTKDTQSSASSASGSSQSAASGSGAYTTLKKGDKGDEVLKLQNRLKELGYMFVKPSGEYAEGTEQSVKDFQYLNNLVVTGVADAKTQTLLYSDSAKKRTD